jgi:hypothetical protein
MEISFNVLEQQIITELCEQEFYNGFMEYEGNLKKYLHLASLPNAEIVKLVFELRLQEEYGCSIATVHEQIDYLKGIPIDTIPSDLFRSAIQVAMKNIDWAAIAKDTEVAEAIKLIKGN